MIACMETTLDIIYTLILIYRYPWHHYNNIHSNLQGYNRALLASQHQEHTS